MGSNKLINRAFRGFREKKKKDKSHLDALIPCRGGQHTPVVRVPVDGEHCPVVAYDVLLVFVGLLHVPNL